jgi:hypothetical protein
MRCVRYPFDEIAKAYDNVSLVRVNKSMLNHENNDIIITDEDIHELLTKLKDC